MSWRNLFIVSGLTLPSLFEDVSWSSAPSTSIDVSPSDPGLSSVTFEFSGTAGAFPIDYFQYRLDFGVWTTAVSPLNLTGLSLGTHYFQVRAVDEAGVPDKTPPSYEWEVNGI